MTNQLPEPLTPADCDLRAMPWFPLRHKDLLESDWWKGASDVARSRSVNLWAKAYQKVPAASLKASEIDLAEDAGFGRDMDAWARHRDEIMAPWVLCSDGRYYHPTLADVALETWAKGEAKRKFDRERKARQRSKGGTLDVSQAEHPQGPTATPAEVPPENAHTIQNRTGEDKNSEIQPPNDSGKVKSVAASKPPKVPKEKKPPADKRGSRIRFGWTADETDRAHALTKGNYTDGQLIELEDAFFDHWKAKPGSSGVMLDWRATWRTWVRNDIKFNGAPDGRQPPRRPGPASAPGGPSSRDSRRDNLIEGAVEALKHRR